MVSIIQSVKMHMKIALLMSWGTLLGLFLPWIWSFQQDHHVTNWKGEGIDVFQAENSPWEI